MSGTVSKHVTLVGELSRLVGANNLMELSEAEQQLACQEGHSEVVQVSTLDTFTIYPIIEKVIEKIIFNLFVFKKIRNLIKDPKVKTSDIVRLISLYALRYEKSGNSELSLLRDNLLKRGGLSDSEREVFIYINFFRFFYL